jgi:hypothetical protein
VSFSGRDSAVAISEQDNPPDRDVFIRDLHSAFYAGRDALYGFSILESGIYRRFCRVVERYNLFGEPGGGNFTEKNVSERLADSSDSDQLSEKNEVKRLFRIILKSWHRPLLFPCELFCFGCFVPLLV